MQKMHPLNQIGCADQSLWNSRWDLVICSQNIVAQKLFLKQLDKPTHNLGEYKIYDFALSAKQITFGLNVMHKNKKLMKKKHCTEYVLALHF